MRPHRRQPTRLLYPWDSPGKNTGVGCHFLLQCMKVKSESEVAQLCPTPSDPMDWMQSTRLLRPWDFLGKSTGVGCHCLKWVRFEQNFVEKSNEKLTCQGPWMQNNNFAQWLSFSPLHRFFFFFYNSESFLGTKILFSIYIKNINRASLVGADVENPEPHLFSISNIFWKETQIGNHVFWQGVLKSSSRKVIWWAFTWHR